MQIGLPFGTAAFLFLLLHPLSVLGFTCLIEHNVVKHHAVHTCRKRYCPSSLLALSDHYLQDDLVAVRQFPEGVPRLCAVTTDGAVVPLCLREDDVETDLLADPREFSASFWKEAVTDENVVRSYGEGYYGQRPVPSLGGGPGYGADADEVWSVSGETLDAVRNDGVVIPVLDMGIAHGEKARGGSF